jgi:hypothetical protein
MRRCIILAGLWMVMGLLTITNVYSQKSAPSAPFDQGSWILGLGIGPATPMWGNGYGFGPGFKVFVENGTFKLGPGILALGGNIGVSYFSHRWDYLVDHGREYWFNFMFAPQAVYHYGWDVKGLDTYGGIPLGIGFNAYGGDKFYGALGHHVVYPNFGIIFGSSYYFNDHFGVNGEFGYNVTYANLGVVFKLN